MQLDGSGYRELKSGDGLAAVALSDNTLLWMTISGNDVLVMFTSSQKVALFHTNCFCEAHLFYIQSLHDDVRNLHTKYEILSSIINKQLVL